MTRDEAIRRIKAHKAIHKMDEPRAIYISEALDMAIEALERKRGKWIEAYEDYRQQISWWECSVCKYGVSWKPNYCPNCGAEMEHD